MECQEFIYSIHLRGRRSLSSDCLVLLHPLTVIQVTINRRSSVWRINHSFWGGNEWNFWIPFEDRSPFPVSVVYFSRGRGKCICNSYVSSSSFPFTQIGDLPSLALFLQNKCDCLKLFFWFRVINIWFLAMIGKPVPRLGQSQSSCKQPGPRRRRDAATFDLHKVDALWLSSPLVGPPVDVVGWVAETFSRDNDWVKCLFRPCAETGKHEVIMVIFNGNNRLLIPFCVCKIFQFMFSLHTIYCSRHFLRLGLCLLAHFFYCEAFTQARGSRGVISIEASKMRSSLRVCFVLYLVMQSSAAFSFPRFVFLYHLQLYELQSIHLTNCREHV